MLHGILVWFGVTNASGTAYLAWSGILSDISEFAVFLAIMAWCRKHNCHVNRCWRFAIHPVKGTPHIVCRKHHPDNAPSAQQVLDESEAAKS